MNIIVIILIVTIIYGQNRFSLLKNLYIKRFIIDKFDTKKQGERTIRAIITVVLVFILAFIEFMEKVNLKNSIFGEYSILYSILLLVSAILIFIQMIFMINYIISIVFKSNITEFMHNIDIMELDINSMFYTGYFITFMVSLFEGIVFFDIICYSLLETYEFKLWIVIVTITIIYGLMKAIMRRSIKKNISLFVLGISICLPGLLLTLITNSLFIGVCFLFICNLFVSFKNIKAGIRR
ncbi:hypothetical protein PV797_02805 [Clostridiaceae bacterium M8S5]|nr:hypothetical protein PV797_02805 [Clostridiaceae bacterium M8S5]